MEELSQEDRHTVQHFQKLSSTLSGMDGHVYFCKFGPAYDQKFKKITLALDTAWEPVLVVIMRCLQSLGADVKHGPPPKSAAERLTAKLLRELKGAQCFSLLDESSVGTAPQPTEVMGSKFLRRGNEWPLVGSCLSGRVRTGDDT